VQWSRLESMADTMLYFSCFHNQRSRSLNEKLYFPLHACTLYKVKRKHFLANLFPIIKGFTIFIVMVTREKWCMKLIPLQSCTLYIQRKQFMSGSFNFAYLFTGLALKANWTNCSKLGPGLEFTILGCSSTHNRIYREQQWVPHLLRPVLLAYHIRRMLLIVKIRRKMIKSFQ
jgi:hypothetical protein